jgi:hypothetical protein
VAGITVGDGDELHGVSHLRELRGGAAGANIAVIGMRPECDDTQLSILRRERTRSKQK